ncbi:RNA polymerase sigma-70 factor (ECF subfamily) [Alteromonadaceae bacterium 2753L.S.0a.02]|nr:RNA polymerase sigma-70 factor (ECF subfamily) [Alteromonadaceae bacterium 2753L.S.0a.02]
MTNVMSGVTEDALQEAATPLDLVQRIRNGDSLAEHQLVEKYQRGLRLVLQRKSNPGIAEEVCQETWRVVLENLRQGKLRDPQKLAAYITQTGRNQLIMYFRRNENTGADSSKTVEPTTTFGPQDAVEQQRLRNIIQKLLDELNKPRDREILQRFYLDEEDKVKICEDLSLSDLHFNRVLHRAKQRFRALVESHDNIT